MYNTSERLDTHLCWSKTALSAIFLMCEVYWRRICFVPPPNTRFSEDDIRFVAGKIKSVLEKLKE